MFNDHDGLSSEWKKVGQHAQQDKSMNLSISFFASADNNSKSANPIA